jgi:hypothetical protein
MSMQRFHCGVTSIAILPIGQVSPTCCRSDAAYFSWACPCFVVKEPVVDNHPSLERSTKYWNCVLGLNLTISMYEWKVELKCRRMGARSTIRCSGIRSMTASYSVEVFRPKECETHEHI